MRRNDYDVTDSIRTTDPEAVAGEVVRIYRTLYNGTPVPELERAFRTTSSLYPGRHPGLPALRHRVPRHPARARCHPGHGAADGRLRSSSRRKRRFAEPAARRLRVGVATRCSTTSATCAGVTTTATASAPSTRSRTSPAARAYLRRYVGELGSTPLRPVGAHAGALHRLRAPGGNHPVSDTLLRRVGQMLGTADIIAQMSDRCYLEKCRDRLYPGVRARRARRTQACRRPHAAVLFASGDDLVQKTPGFYQGALKRLDLQLARAYEYAATHFGGQNLYLDEMQKNVELRAERGGRPVRRACGAIRRARSRRRPRPTRRT